MAVVLDRGSLIELSTTCHTIRPPKSLDRVDTCKSNRSAAGNYIFQVQT
jgi:hypothetical protein